MKRLTPFVLTLALPGLTPALGAVAADAPAPAISQTEYNKMLDQKIAALDALIKADPKNVQAWDDRATAKRLRRKDGTADAAQAVRLQPDSASLHYHQALALIAVYQTDHAIEAMGQAIKLEPGVARWPAYRSILETLGGKKSEALADLQAAKTLAPADPAVAKAAAAIDLPPPPRNVTMDDMNKPIPQLTLAQQGVGP